MKTNVKIDIQLSYLIEVSNWDLKGRCAGTVTDDRLKSQKLYFSEGLSDVQLNTLDTESEQTNPKGRKFWLWNYSKKTYERFQKSFRKDYGLLPQ